MVVQEVSPGNPDNPQAQYVMLIMTTPAQGQVNTKAIAVQDSAGLDVEGLPPVVSWLSTSAPAGISSRYDIAAASLDKYDKGAYGLAALSSPLDDPCPWAA